MIILKADVMTEHGSIKFPIAPLSSFGNRRARSVSASTIFMRPFLFYIRGSQCSLFTNYLITTAYALMWISCVYWHAMFCIPLLLGSAHSQTILYSNQIPNMTSLFASFVSKHLIIWLFKIVNSLWMFVEVMQKDRHLFDARINV